jgi:predicted P-loop ATPase
MSITRGINKNTGANLPENEDGVGEPYPNIEESGSIQKRKPKGLIEDIPLFIKVGRFINSLYDLQFNEVTNEIEFKTKEESEFQLLNENNLYRVLQHNNIKISMANLMIMLRSDYVTTVNPFIEYFHSLPQWKEGDPDNIEDFSNYIIAKDQPSFKNHFKKALVRCIACALNDTYFNKHALVLVGKIQHTGKSTFIRFLCPPRLKKYISESISFQEKDNLIGLTENFIINIDELAVLNKIEINALKSYFSKELVKVRHPYDRKPMSTPRRASFFGSTNKSEFLSDETGSVRWLCFEIEHIRFAYREEINIDLVWSQAYTLYKNGFNYQLTKEEIEQNESRNQRFQHTSIEIELIQKFFSPGTKEDHQEFYTATDFINSLGEKTMARSTINVITIGRALSYLGYEKVQKIKDGSGFPVKGYYVNFLTP